MPEQERSHMVLRLIGGRDPDGEISLEALAKISAGAQQVVRRVARSLSDRSGPGRSPAHLEDLTRLVLVGIHAGSTALDIKGPPLAATLDLRDLPADAGTQAIATSVRGLASVSIGGPLPEGFDELSINALDALLSFLGETAPEFEMEASFGGQRHHVPRTSIEDARRVLAGFLEPTTHAPTSMRTVEGVLYAVNLHTGRYQVEDDLGQTIVLTTSRLASDQVAPMLGRRVRATGTSTLDNLGRIIAVEADDLTPAFEPDFVDTEAFFRGVELDELLEGVRPVRAINDLQMKGLTAEEAQTYLADLDD